MPLSKETQELLDLAIQQVAEEGYNVAGFYMRSDQPEFVDFTFPNRSRANMAAMVKAWLDLLENHQVSCEEIKQPKIYQA